MKSRWELQAAPFGDRCGVVRVADGSLSVRLVVYPKLWRARPDGVAFDWADPRQELTVSVCELQKFIVRTHDSRRTGLVDELVSLASLPGGDAGGLLAQCAVAEVDVAGVEPGSDFERALALLAVTYGVVQLDSLCGTFSKSRRWSTIDRYLIFESLLACAAAVDRGRRANYVPMRSHSVQLRGRPVAIDLAMHERHRLYSIRSDFSSLTNQDQLAFVIATALAQIVFGASAEHGDRVLASQRSRALAVLSGWPVQAVGVDRALAMVPAAQALCQNRLESQALRLSVLALRQQGHATAGAESRSSLRISVDTPRMWELLVIEHLKARGFTDVIDGNSGAAAGRVVVYPPWRAPGIAVRRPDLAFRSLDGWHIADAKYKSIGHGVPGTSDLNQMFVYASLARVDGEAPSSAHLFYPTSGPDLESRTLASQVGGVPDLRIALIRFPGVEEVLSG